VGTVGSYSRRKFGYITTRIARSPIDANSGRKTALVGGTADEDTILSGSAPTGAAFAPKTRRHIAPIAAGTAVVVVNQEIPTDAIAAVGARKETDADSIVADPVRWTAAAAVRVGDACPDLRDR
jgi:hypothetical protein